MPTGPAIKGHRIVTLTMNPALDIATSTATVQRTEKLRCSAARYDPGGGGVNVAHVADVLAPRRRRYCRPAARQARWCAICSSIRGSPFSRSRSVGRPAKASRSTNSAPKANTGSYFRAGIESCRTGRMPADIATGRGVGSHRRGKWQPSARRPARLLPAGVQCLRRDRRDIHAGHLGRWTQANRVGVFLLAESSRTTRVRRSGTRYRGGATCRRTRPGHTRMCRARPRVAGRSGCPAGQPARRTTVLAGTCPTGKRCRRRDAMVAG